MSLDADRPIRLRTVFLAGSAFTVLAVLVAIRQLSEGRVQPLGALAIVAGGALLGMAVGLGVFTLSGTASQGLIQALYSAGNLPPAPSYSLQETMIAQGRYQDAADSFRQHLAVHPGDHDARLALGALLCGPGGAHAEAERLFREVQDHHPTGRQEAAASQALIDHYVATGQRGRHMAELARFAERYRGTAAGRAARQALTAMKVPAPER